MPEATSIQQRKRIPEWLRMKLPSSSAFTRTRSLLDELNLHTVCESAKCPNHWECWSKGTATFMIAGDRCTRACGFCAVDTRKPVALEIDEPARVAEATRRMQLKHVVITAVARDDLIDGGFGDDRLLGYNGQDLILGGAGAAYVNGGNDNDLIYGG